MKRAYGNNPDKCPMCGSADIGTEGNADFRKEQKANEVIIEPLTCNSCYAAITRLYTGKVNSTDNYFGSFAITAD